MDPLKGKISFLTKVEGTLCERMMLSKVVRLDGLAKVISGRVVGLELLGLGKGESGMEGEVVLGTEMLKVETIGNGFGC